MRNWRAFIHCLTICALFCDPIVCAKSAAPGKKMIALKPNRLVHEKSPYLQQHAYNPVEWFPWGEEAFQKSRRENKPLLVSIGYSTCHWCHVMERESFSNPQIAALMNRFFVNIKVDREERPDVDKIYMTAVTAMSGHGGWPLNVFLTPDLKPFYGGTYFPPQDRWGTAGWQKLVEAIGESWSDADRRQKFIQSSEELTRSLQRYLSGAPSKGEIRSDLLDHGFHSYEDDYDSRFGGFGGAPKFPMPVTHNFLLRYSYSAGKDATKSNQAKTALSLSIETLRSMARGGIYDRLGGGFHRYSTDERWHVPHFEKMLYDNAQLAVNYLEAYQIVGDPLFSQTARETLDYILRDMSHPEGGLYSAEDADSLPQDLVGKFSPEEAKLGTAPDRALSLISPEEAEFHKLEGAFYVWSKKEILNILRSQGEIFCAVYGVEENGNVASDPHGEFPGKNVLFTALSIDAAAKKFWKSESEIRTILKEAKKSLFLERARRPRPHLDDKVLTAWNGLGITALSKGYQVLQDEKYRQAAERAARFIHDNLYEKGKRQLYRRWRQGEKKVLATADDYAFLVQGLLDLYESTFNAQWLKWAMELTEEQNKRFFDSDQGGFFMTGLSQNESLIARVKEEQDNVEPSASSVATMNLLRLARWTDKNEYREMAEKTLRYFSPKMDQVPRSLPQMMAALNFALGDGQEIVIVGKPGLPETQAMVREVYRRFLPNKVLVLLDPDAPQENLMRAAPWLKPFLSSAGKPTAYVCVQHSCQLPTSDLKQFVDLLDH